MDLEQRKYRTQAAINKATRPDSFHTDSISDLDQDLESFVSEPLLSETGKGDNAMWDGKGCWLFSCPGGDFSHSVSRGYGRVMTLGNGPSTWRYHA
jgi:hypothetical protein